MIKVVLNNLPSYYLGIFKMPKLVGGDSKTKEVWRFGDWLSSNEECSVTIQVVVEVLQ